MRVIYKPTGQLGDIPDDKFDPSLFAPAQTQTPQTQQPVAPQPAPQQSLAEKIGGGIVNAGKSLALPFARTSANIITSGVTIPQALIAGAVGKFNPQLGAQIASPDILGTQTQAGKIAADPKKALKQQAFDSANVASYAVPFGKGSNIATKALLPGAVVGGASTLNENSTPQSILGNAAIGAGTAGLLYGAGKIFGKAGEKLSETGENARVGKVKLKSDLYGAENEKAVSDVMKKYGIKGTPQAKYEQLAPTVEGIGQDIQSALSANPQTTSMQAVKDTFMKKIAPSVRQGDITLEQASQAFDDYFTNNVIPATPGFTDTPSIETLFNLKKDVQASSSQVAKALQKSESKATLTPTEKIMKTLRDSLDAVISDANPEVKQLTLDQSRLYDAVKPVYAQRNTVPTVRALGITIPQGPVNAVKDAAGKTLEGAGSAAGAFSTIGSPAAMQAAARLPSIIPEQNGDQPQNGLNPQQSQENGYNGTDHATSLPPIGQQSYVTGYSPEALYQAYEKAISANDQATANVLRQMYTDETTYQKTQSGGVGKPKSAAALQVLGKTKAGLAALDTIEAQIAANPNVLSQAAIPGSPGARVYEAAVSSITDAIGGLRTGATVSPQQQEFYKNLLPKWGDSANTIQQKLAAVRNELNIYAQGLDESQSTATLPPIESSYPQ